MGKENAVEEEAFAISADMRELYERAKKREIQREEADTLANIAGKNLKALSTILVFRALENDTRTIGDRATLIAASKPKFIAGKSQSASR